MEAKQLAILVGKLVLAASIIKLYASFNCQAALLPGTYPNLFYTIPF